MVGFGLFHHLVWQFIFPVSSSWRASIQNFYFLCCFSCWIQIPYTDQVCVAVLHCCGSDGVHRYLAVLHCCGSDGVHRNLIMPPSC